MMKSIYTLFFLFSISINVNAQIYTYTNTTTGAPDNVATNANGANLMRVNGANAPSSPCGTGFSSTNFTSASTYATTLPAVSVQVSPNAGYKLTITDFSVGIRRSGTGPSSVRLAYSLDGGTSWVDKGVNDAPNNAGCGATVTATWDPADFDVTSSSSGIIFRIFCFGATSTAGTFQILNLTINGSVSTACATPTNQPTSLILTPSLNTVSGSFTPAAAGTTPATGYLVLVSPTASPAPQPNIGDVYAIDDVIGNARVVSIDNSTSFTSSGLNPGTTYYFFIYSNNNSTECYNLVSPLTGTVATNSPPPCTAPSVQASGLSAANISGTSMDLSYTRGSGDSILVIGHTGSPVNDVPINSVNYPVGAQIGSGNFIIYKGTATGFTYSGLAQNTTYYFALYEYNHTNYCYSSNPLTGNFTTICTSAVNVSTVKGTAGNAKATISWTDPNAGCFDQIKVVVSNAAITGLGGDYTGTPNTTYAGGAQLVYSGTGTSVTVTGLTNGTSYYCKVFTKNGSSYSAGVQITVTPFDPASGFLYLYGNLHSHSSYSDGNKDNTSKIPQDDFKYARDVNCMDFLGISEHNHSQAGMHLADFPHGYTQADTLNLVTSPLGNSIVTLYGMEWGVISGGGHVVVYGFNDQLIGWEAGNYNIFCAKSDYSSLWTLVNGQPNAFATLAHPNSTDFGNVASAYNLAADNAVYGVAIESGPAFSTSTSYSDFPSSLGYFSYYKTMLAKGYHLGAQMDQDNHNLTFGTANTNRMVVLATAKTRDAITDAIRSMRFYASEDCNARLDYKAGTAVMGSLITQAGLPSLSVTVTDPDANESVNTIDVWGGVVGGSVPSAPLKTYSGLSSITFNNTNTENIQPDNSTYYYFVVVTQGDGNKIISSPIWYTRSDASAASEYFRTVASGNWNSIATWESSADNASWHPATVTPDLNSNTITILSGHTVTVTANVSTDQTVVNQGGAIVVGSGATLSINDGTGADIIVNGALTVNSGGSMVIRSTASGTASVGASTGTITGNVTVERFIPANSHREWRYLSVPVTGSQTINASWQNGQAAGVAGPSGIGTMITSNNSNASFDFQTPGNSIQVYNPTTDTWGGITNTTSPIATDNGYMLFVRGDRTATPSNGTITATTLSTTGPLKQGSYPAVPLPVTSGKFASVGNPYPSQIDFRNVTKSAGVDNTFYVWDPKLTGSYGLGAYQTMTFDGTNYIITPGGGSYGASGSVMNTIESGQGFFVHGTSSGTVSFTENAKTNNSTQVYRTSSTVSKSLITNLYSVETTGDDLADGTMNLFDNSYSDDVDGGDALKLTNFGLNLSIVKNSKVLSVEKSQELLNSDTIAFSLQGAKQQQYRFEFTATGLDHPGLSAYLVDRYTNSSSPVDLNGITSVIFTVNADAGSSAADRFAMVFSKPSIVNTTPSINVYPNPVRGSNISLQLVNQPKGTYDVQLINMAGQVNFRNLLQHPGGINTQTLGLNNPAPGVYILEITKPDNTRERKKIIISSK